MSQQRFHSKKQIFIQFWTNVNSEVFSSLHLLYRRSEKHCSNSLKRNSLDFMSITKFLWSFLFSSLTFIHHMITSKHHFFKGILPFYHPSNPKINMIYVYNLNWTPKTHFVLLVTYIFPVMLIHANEMRATATNKIMQEGFQCSVKLANCNMYGSSSSAELVVSAWNIKSCCYLPLIYCMFLIHKTTTS